MAWFMLSFFIVLALLGPLYGADTRDGRPSRFAPVWRPVWQPVWRRQNAR
ncbi:hypothetical protein [Actinoallomurus acaciae]|uniref:Uncharacterized protein n=1 Tax=Actinoallomurus acaciae TaxID=502577 RepID=A0ABV5YDT6_9ACTN